MESTVFFRAHAQLEGRCDNFISRLKLPTNVGHSDSRKHLVGASEAEEIGFVKTTGDMIAAEQCCVGE